MLARGSRQARCPDEAPAAGIDAASMARRCHKLFKRSDCFSFPAEASPGDEVDVGLMRRVTGPSRGIARRWPRPRAPRHARVLA